MEKGGEERVRGKLKTLLKELIEVAKVDKEKTRMVGETMDEMKMIVDSTPKEGN